MTDNTDTRTLRTSALSNNPENDLNGMFGGLKLDEQGLTFDLTLDLSEEEVVITGSYEGIARVQEVFDTHSIPYVIDLDEE